MTRNTQIVHSFHLLAPAGDRIQNDTAGQTQERQQHEARGQDGCGETRHQAGLQERNEYRPGQNDRASGENGKKQAKKRQRPFLLGQQQDGP